MKDITVWSLSYVIQSFRLHFCHSSRVRVSFPQREFCDLHNCFKRYVRSYQPEWNELSTSTKYEFYSFFCENSIFSVFFCTVTVNVKTKWLFLSDSFAQMKLHNFYHHHVLQYRHILAALTKLTCALDKSFPSQKSRGPVEWLNVINRAYAIPKAVPKTPSTIYFLANIRLRIKSKAYGCLFRPFLQYHNKVI